MTQRSPFRMTIALLLAAGLHGGCSDEDEGGAYACSYEQRTSGCDGYSYGPWEPGCTTFDSDAYYIAPEEVCGNITDGGLHCASSCCIDAEFRNVVLRRGTCP